MTPVLASGPRNKIPPFLVLLLKSPASYIFGTWAVSLCVSEEWSFATDNLLFYSSTTGGGRVLEDEENHEAFMGSVVHRAGSWKEGEWARVVECESGDVGCGWAGRRRLPARGADSDSICCRKGCCCFRKNNEPSISSCLSFVDAVCLDGTLPGYHLHGGYGSGANSWVVHLEGGGWCENVRACTFLKTTHHGSSKYMEKLLPFTGILSNKAEENPDFYNWNRVKIRYCDGASFSGEGHDEVHGLFFRGQWIWLAAMEDLLSKGMHYANQALLTGCSAGGLSTILHCDEFRALFPLSTKVKCLADAGLFLDVVGIAGARAVRSMFQDVVNLQGVVKNLPQTCTSRMKNPALCFFPQNIINDIRTPIFLLNSAYDLWQIVEGIAPPSADPQGYWRSCKRSHVSCNASQMAVLQVFRNQILDAVKLFSLFGKNGLFINSCFTHCQSESQTTWFANGSPVLRNKRIAQSVGDWFFDRSAFKVIDCPYPCDKSCHHQN